MNICTRAIVALCLFFALLVGCDSRSSSSSSTTQPNGSSSGKRIVIGFVVKQPEEPWFQDEWKFAQQAADEKGFKLVKIGAQDGEKVDAAIDNLSAQGAQGFVICTPEVRLGSAIQAKAQSHDMKVIAVDDRLLGPDGKYLDIPYMGISAHEIGKNVGKALAEEMKKRGWKPEETAAMGLTQPELDTAKQRTDGATESLIEAGFAKDKIYSGPLGAKAEVATAIDAANILLTQHPEIKNWLIFGMNDEAVLGGVRATEGRGFDANHVIGIGIGGATGKTDFQRKDPTGFYAAVLISPKRHGYETTMMMYDWIKDGKQPPKETFTAGILINRENYQQVMKEQGVE